MNIDPLPLRGSGEQPKAAGRVTGCRPFGGSGTLLLAQAFLSRWDRASSHDSSVPHGSPALVRLAGRVVLPDKQVERVIIAVGRTLQLNISSYPGK
jgi:hypothetical protein